MQTLYVSGEVWMWVHWIYEMSQIIQKNHLFKINNFSYHSISDDSQWNRQNNEYYNFQCTNSK